MRRLFVSLSCLIALAIPAGEVRAETAATPLVKIAISAPTHRPEVGKPWVYTVRVTNRAGRPLGGTIVPVVVQKGQRIDTVGWFRLRHGRFEGTYRWRQIHAEKPLFFRARVQVTKQWRYADFWIRVQS